MGPYQRTPKEVARARRFSGLGVRSVGPVGDFLETIINISKFVETSRRWSFKKTIGFWSSSWLCSQTYVEGDYVSILHRIYIQSGQIIATSHEFSPEM